MHRSQWLGFAPNRRRGVDNPSRTYAHAPVIMSKPTLPTVEERGRRGAEPPNLDTGTPSPQPLGEGAGGVRALPRFGATMLYADSQGWERFDADDGGRR